jgi:hypothetical protein
VRGLAAKRHRQEQYTSKHQKSQDIFHSTRPYTVHQTGDSPASPPLSQYQRLTRRTAPFAWLTPARTAPFKSSAPTLSRSRKGVDGRNPSG